MDIWRIVGQLSVLVIAVFIIILMRLINKSRPLNTTTYLVTYLLYVGLIWINVLIPLWNKILVTVVAIIILGIGYTIEKKLKRN